MASTSKEPAQAERLEAVADATVAGPGATDKSIVGDPLSEKHEDSPSSSDPELGKPGGAQHPPEKPEAPQRSKMKIFLIMFSLCVGASPGGKCIPLTKRIARCLPRCA